jgi:UDP-glucose 4-epimerase
MILISGGMGFIGIAVARELAAHDEVVVGYNRTRKDPAELRELIGRDVGAVRFDTTDPMSVATAVATRQPDRIVHLAVPGLGELPPGPEAMANVSGLVNVLEAARLLDVARVTLASSLAVYAGLTGGPFDEDRSLPVASANATGAMKKAEEIIAAHYADRTGLALCLLRIGVVYGPLYRTLANPAGRFTHLALRGELPAGLAPEWQPAQLAGGTDLIHVTDCARAIASVTLAEHPRHRIYNVGQGAMTRPAEIVAAIDAAVPGAELPAGVRNPGPIVDASGHMDITRISEEFGFAPRHTIESGIADYVGWLATHPV